MENYLDVFVLSVLVVLVAIYGYIVEQRIESQHRDEMKKVKEEMIQKDNACRKERNQTNKNVKELEKALNEIKKELHTQRPRFYVTLSSHTTLGQTQRIEFDQIITDVANCYNKITGVFKVPKDGLYQFSFTMFPMTGGLHAEIMQNHQVVGKNHGASTGVSGTINVVITCKQGDSIFVRHMEGMGAQNIFGERYPAFSGFLID